MGRPAADFSSLRRFFLHRGGALLPPACKVRRFLFRRVGGCLLVSMVQA